MLAIVVVSLFGALFSRLWYLQVMRSTRFEQTASINSLRDVQLPPMRGRILDSAGRILADNKRVLVVTVDRSAIRSTTKRTQLFERLAGALLTPVPELEARYKDAKFDQVLPLPLKEDVDEETAAFVKERYEDYPGVEVVESWQRVYRFAPYAGHILGYIGRVPADQKAEYLKLGYKLSDSVGIAGIERAYEPELRGTPGSQRIEVDAQNRFVRVVSEVPAKPGDDVQLTIDLSAQQLAEQTLQKGLTEARSRSPRNEPDKRFAAEAGSVVVQDPSNGRIVALASNPAFDPRWFVNPLPKAKFDQLFGDGRNSPLVDRAVQGEYAPGSTFKLISASAGLSSGTIGADVKIDDTGTYKAPNCTGGPDVCPTLQNAQKVANGLTDMRKAVTVSSDVYFYSLGYELFNRPGQVLQNEAKAFGFGKPSGIQLPDEHAGRIPSVESKKYLYDRKVIKEASYNPGDNMNFAVGQGITAVTPLQLANAYSAFANGGTLYTASVVQAVLVAGTPDLTYGQVDLSKATVLRAIEIKVAGKIDLPPAVRQPILDGLVGVVNNPTGTAYDVFKDFPLDQLPIAGKTGTAQDGTKEAVKDDSLFASFAPYNAPRFTVVAVLENAGFGAEAAAPVVKRIYQGLYAMLPNSPVQQATPLDPASVVAATMAPLPDVGTLLGVTGRD